MANPKVLIVDDSLETQKTLARLFLDIGFEVSVVGTADAAMSELRIGKRPDVIILDFEMPGEMDGPDFFSAVREDGKFQDIAVVPFSSHWDPQPITKLSIKYILAAIKSKEGTPSEKMGGVRKEGGRSDVKKIPDQLFVSVANELAQRDKPVPEPLAELVLEILTRERLI